MFDLPPPSPPRRLSLDLFVSLALAVCVSVLEQIHESMPAADRKKKDKIEAAIDTFCDQRLSSRDDKMVSVRQ